MSRMRGEDERRRRKIVTVVLNCMAWKKKKVVCVNAFDSKKRKRGKKRMKRDSDGSEAK